MVSPKPLQPGDKIGIVATARRVTEENIEHAVNVFQDWGLSVVLSPLLFSKDHSYLAGTDEQRAAAIQQFLDDDSIKAIICARGGYGTTRIIDQLDFKHFTKSPKWIVGFSDITALHLKLGWLGFESIHGTMPILFSREDSRSSVQHMKMALFGETLTLSAPASTYNKEGEGRGHAIGGNLSLIVDSLGTPYEPETRGKVLVLEEVDEYLYKIDRMMVQLKRAQKLEGLAGLALGHFTDIKDTELKFGETVEEIMRFHTREYSYPVGFNFPTGHENPNHSWIEAREVLLKVSADGSSIVHASLPDEVYKGSA